MTYKCDHCDAEFLGPQDLRIHKFNHELDLLQKGLTKLREYVALREISDGFYYGTRRDEDLERIAAAEEEITRVTELQLAERKAKAQRDFVDNH